MKGIKMKRVLLGAMLAILMVTSTHGLTGCVVCRDCGPGRHFRHW